MLGFNHYYIDVPLIKKLQDYKEEDFEQQQVEAR
jgi:hypothetical protein